MTQAILSIGYICFMLKVVLKFLLLPLLFLPGILNAQAPVVKDTVRYFIKYNPSASIRGDHEFGIQRSKGNSALELSAGLTTGNPFLETTQGRLFDNNYTPVSSRKKALGYSIKLQAKQYVVDRFYVSAQGALIHYNYRFPLENVNPLQTGEQKENIRYLEGRILLGYELLLAQKRLMLDIYAGVGLKNRTIRFFEEQSFYDNAGNYIFGSGTYAVSENLPGVYFGIKAGWRLQ
jgi:hypothetical protein